MGTMARRMQVLVALTVGCGLGRAAPGCGTALASDTVTVECKTAGQRAEYTLPDTTPETFARLSVVNSFTCDGKSVSTVVPFTGALDGVVNTACEVSSCPQGGIAAVSFVLR